MTRMAVFASGSGTNAERIIRHFSNNARGRVICVLTNNPKAGVIDRSRKCGIECFVFTKADLLDSQVVQDKLQELNIDFIILAGFLLLIPKSILAEYEGRIVNIHPALLPLHGGKGFYGTRVHESVIASKAIMSGITIHHVNEKFDAGEIIFQAGCHITHHETADSLADKIHLLEYSYYPIVIEKLLSGRHD